MSTSLVTSRPCGCVVMIVVNEQETVAGWAKEIAEEIAAGRVPAVLETDQVNKMPLKCLGHPWGWEKGKPRTAPPPKPRGDRGEQQTLL